MSNGPNDIRLFTEKIKRRGIMDVKTIFTTRPNSIMAWSGVSVTKPCERGSELDSFSEFSMKSVGMF
jgi:hypothetical protein